MSKNIKYFHISVVLVSFLVLIASVLYFKYKDSPPKFANVFLPVREAALIMEVKDTLVVGQPFVVEVKTDSKKQPINVIGLYLQFDPGSFQIMDIDTSNSFCQFYPERKFNNHTGSISLACGSPHPGVSEVNTVMKLTFLPLKPGRSSLLVDPKSQVLMSDGKGTNILLDEYGLELNVLTGI